MGQCNLSFLVGEGPWPAHDHVSISMLLQCIFPMSLQKKRRRRKKVRAPPFHLTLLFCLCWVFDPSVSRGQSLLLRICLPVCCLSAASCLLCSPLWATDWAGPQTLRHFLFLFCPFLVTLPVVARALPQLCPLPSSPQLPNLLPSSLVTLPPFFTLLLTLFKHSFFNS